MAFIGYLYQDIEKEDISTTLNVMKQIEENLIQIKERRK